MKYLRLNAFWLHILAMLFMLSDHLWATVVPGRAWMTCVGRLAFPIFAFMIAEGVYHTKDLKKYAKRLFLFALLSEIPFNYMYDGGPIYPFHQNVLWTFLLAIGCIAFVERVKRRGVLWQTAAAGVLAVAVGWALGWLLMVDYFGYGVLTVLVFYFFRGRRWYHFALQFVCLFYLHAVLAGGMQYSVTLLGHALELPEQGLALLALIPIWLYNGEQGPYNRGIRLAWYSFYPVHMAVLAAWQALL